MFTMGGGLLGSGEMRPTPRIRWFERWRDSERNIMYIVTFLNLHLTLLVRTHQVECILNDQYRSWTVSYAATQQHLYRLN